MKINALTDKIKRLKALQERIADCKQRIRAKICHPNNDICKCKFNIMRECSAEGSHSQHHGREANKDDKIAFEPLINQIREKIKIITDENIKRAVNA